MRCKHRLDEIVACRPDTYLPSCPRIAFEKDQAACQKDVNWPQSSQLTTGESTAALYLDPDLPENVDRIYQEDRQNNLVGKYQSESDAEDIEDLVAPKMSRKVRKCFDFSSNMKENDLEAFESR